MADKNTVDTLFEMLNQPFGDMTQEIKLSIDKIVADNPDIITSTDFATAITNAPDRQQTATNILGNLQQLKKENYLETVDKPEQAVALCARETLKANGGKDPQTDEVEKPRVDVGDKPRQTLSIDQLEMGAYQGTLTAEQMRDLRRLRDEKKVVDMKNLPGDDNKHKREPSKDKFRDEDVIKYMYEEWFLGGASWLFNKVEDNLLNLIDASCDTFMENFEKGRAQKLKIRDDNLKNATDKARSFAKLTNGEVQNLSKECAAKMDSFRDILADLKANLGNPAPQWKHYNKDDPFIKKLEELPDYGKNFIETCGQELDNRLKMIETTGKIAMLATSVEMTDEFMRNDSTWRNDKNVYKDNDELSQEFKLRSRDRHSKILEAVSTLSEDARLVAEVKYERLPEPKPDFVKYTSEQVGLEVNGFLKELGNKATQAVEAQKKEVANNSFAVGSSRFGAGPKAVVASTVSMIDKMINRQIEKGAVYSEKLFEKEHMQERINLKTGLYEEAVKENSSDSFEATLGKMRTLNSYHQSTLDERRTALQSRQAFLKQVRNRLIKRDGNKSFQTRVNNGRIG